jgi:hypothetical protein
MLRTAHFKTSEPEEWTFDENENPEVPGGKALAEKIRGGVLRSTPTVGTVSQHSYYGWRFVFTFEAVEVQCVLNAVGEECHLTIEVASIVPSWLLPRRTREVFTRSEGILDALLRQMPGVSAVTWS